MEKYSDYLINNVYENKTNKSMAKIKITENDLKQIIMESVKRVLKETNDEYVNGRNYYDEFDMNIPDEEDYYYNYKLRFMRGDFSKEVINTLINGCKEKDEEAIDAYEYAKMNNICPKFIKAVESNLAWDELQDITNSETRGYSRTNYGERYADTDHENSNRFHIPQNGLRTANWKTNGNVINYKKLKDTNDGWHLGVLAQQDGEKGEMARKFKGKINDLH